MKRLRGFAYLLLLLPLLLSAPALASAAQSNVIIVEVQTAGFNNGADEEFVEIYNPTDQAWDISSWKLQYLSAGGSVWQNKATLHGSLYPEGRLVITSSALTSVESSINFAPGFKLEAGHVRLVRPNPDNDTEYIIEDTLGWGTALHPETKPATFAPAGSSMTRRSIDGVYIDTDNNFEDFEISASPSPISSNPASLPEDTDEQSTETPTIEEAETDETLSTIDEPEELDEEQLELSEELAEPIPEIVNDQAVQTIQITELLPNPAAPLSDDTDEYIEIYNPNNEAVDLENYSMQTGNNYSYSYTLRDVTIQPKSYLVLYVSETGLVLANSSGKARLLSPHGDILSEALAYEDAKEGQAWAYIDNVWQWTALSTPGAVNAVDVKGAATVAAAKTPKPKAAKVAKPKTAKSTKPKTTAKKEAKKSAAKKDDKVKENAATIADESKRPPSIHGWIIGLVGAAAVGYAIYEYRHDLANRYHQLRRNRENRRATRATA